MIKADSLVLPCGVAKLSQALGHAPHGIVRLSDRPSKIGSFLRRPQPIGGAGRPAPHKRGRALDTVFHGPDRACLISRPAATQAFSEVRRQKYPPALACGMRHYDAARSRSLQQLRGPPEAEAKKTRHFDRREHRESDRKVDKCRQGRAAPPRTQASMPTRPLRRKRS